MANLTVSVPDALIPRLVAAIQTRYPDVEGNPAQVGKEGVRRLLAECLSTVERDAAALAGITAARAQAEAVRAQAETDASEIS